MRLACLWLALIPGIASACLNDRDTLEHEARNRPAVTDAISGWFDRNPPLYYQMRIDRLEKEASLTTAEVDDLSVAYDRIGESAKAKAVIGPDVARRKSSDEKYRWYANHGTFLAHGWFKAGAKPENIADLKQSVTEIEKAIEINPEAHFGREGTQLAVLRYFLAMKEGKTKESLGEWLNRSLHSSEWERGVPGLIMLGNAWESPDMFAAYAYLLFKNEKPSHAEFAIFRYEELVKAGKVPVTIDPKRGLGEVKQSTGYPVLTEAATKRHEARTKYMMDRLQLGQHPDTDPRFWSGYKPPKRPPPDSKIPWRTIQVGAFFLAAVGLGFTLLLGWELRRNRGKTI